MVRCGRVAPPAPPRSIPPALSWLALTSVGRAAFAAHCQALRAIAGDVG
ncbi:hypothetical protein [Streptomyces sp. NPDC054765]